MTSVVTGIVFTIIVTRNLSQEEFGLWRLIGGLLTYFLIVNPIANYWITRHIARGEEVGKTGLATSGLFSIGASLIYIVAIPFVSDATSSSYTLLLLATALIPVNYISTTLDSINLAFKVQAIGYGMLAFEAAKIPAGLFFVEIGDMDLAGAIIATLLAYGVKISILLYAAKDKLKERYNFAILKRWLRLSWLPIYSNAMGPVFALDVLIFSLILGSVEPLALYAAATTVTALVVHSRGMATALYPKLLADNKKEYVELVFKRMFVFGMPIFAAVIVFAKPALFLLNPIYTGAEPGVYIFALTSMAYVLTSTLYSILMGIERVDFNLESKFSDYLRSKLFLVPTLYYIQYGLYIGLLAVVLLVGLTLGLSQIELIMLWAITSLLTELPFTIYGWRIVKKNLPFIFPIKNIARYIVAATVAAALTYFLNEYILIYDPSIFLFGPRLLLALAIGGAIYFSIAYSMDSDFKTLTKAVLKEISSMGNKS